MTNKMKNILMKSIIQGDETKCIRILNNFDLVLDQSYFDYELLKEALANKLGNVAKILIRKGCRVRNPNKTNLEETPLHLAMKLEDLSVVSTILNNNASIYDKNLQGDTPLHAAFKEKYYKAVNAVLDYITNSDLSFNPDNKDDVVHFHIACFRKHITSVQLYLSLGFDVNSYLSVDSEIDSTEFSSLTPLHYVISKNDYDGDMFKILLERSDLTVKNSNGLTPLHSIYYNYNDRYNAEDGISHSFDLSKIMAEVFKHGNDSKFINAVDNSGVSHFHLCCATNRADCVQIFIDNGVDVNSSISFNCSRNPGFTALHFAAKHASLKVVELLLKNGADSNRADKNGVTPLHSATQILEFSDDEFKVIDILLDYSACPTAVDRLGNTPIHLAFNEIGDSHGCALRVKIMDKLISKLPVKVNLTDKTGLSYFHIVCTRNYPDRVNDYLNSGVAIDSVSHSSMFPGYTALHFAVAFNQKDVVEVLLKKNAQVNIKTSRSKTPLHLACECLMLKFNEIYCEYEKKCQENDEPVDLDWTSNRKKQIDIIKLLLLYGADIEAKNSSKLTPLISAFNVEDPLEYWSTDLFENSLINEINTRLIEIINIFLSNKAKISGSKNDQCSSIFHVISKSDLPKISDALMECLLTAGADINAVDKNGLTPLHHAARSSKDELVHSFLKYKANANIKCKKFETPLKLAINLYKQNEQFLRDDHELYESSQSCIRILLEYGSDVNAKTPDGRSLLHDAVSSSSTFLIENLLKHGADINLEDSSGNSPVCSLFPRVLDTNVDDINWLHVLITIFIHLQKLLALGLYVSDKVQKFCNYLPQNCKPLIFDKCINELSKMQMIKIDNYNSLYNILLKASHELSKHLKNNRLIEILETQDIDETFPLYSYLLKLQYKRGLLRRGVLKEAQSSLIYITNTNLPEACYDLILSYLTNEEVVNLKVAAVGKTKRKLSENYSNETQSASKLQKQK